MRIERVSKRERGMALMVVVGTIAVASLMALAMLSSSSLQAQMGGTIPEVAQADYLAESGIHYAIHQLRKTAASDDVYAGGTHTLGGDGRERIMVTVVRQSGSATDYDISSRGEVLNVKGEVIAAKSADATVKVHTELKYGHAAVLAANEVRFEERGRIEIESMVARRVVMSGVTLVKSLLAQLITGDTEGVEDRATTAEFPYRVTPKSAVRTFGDAPYLYSDGNLYWAQPLPTGNLTRTTLGPTDSNPAGVYYRHGTVTLGHKAKINGSLIILNGDLRVEGANTEIDGSQSHSQGFPALVVRDGDILQSAPLSSLEVQGVTWVGGIINNAALFTQMTFRGVVILPTGNFVAHGNTLFNSTIRILHDPSTSNAPRLDREIISDIEILS